GRRGLLELLEARIDHAVSEIARLDRPDLDDLARELELLFPLPAALALARDEDGNFGVGIAAQPAHGVVERHIERRLVVDLDDAVEPLETGAPRGPVGHGIHDGQELVANGDDDAETAE